MKATSTKQGSIVKGVSETCRCMHTKVITIIMTIIIIIIIIKIKNYYYYYYYYNHNYNKILKSDWFSTALISALIGQFNRTVRVMPK